MAPPGHAQDGGSLHELAAADPAVHDIADRRRDPILPARGSLLVHGVPPLPLNRQPGASPLGRHDTRHDNRCQQSFVPSIATRRPAGLIDGQDRFAALIAARDPAADEAAQRVRASRPGRRSWTRRAGCRRPRPGGAGGSRASRSGEPPSTSRAIRPPARPGPRRSPPRARRGRSGRQRRHATLDRRCRAGRWRCR